MKDSLKELVNQQRQEFEFAPPELDDVWQGVEQRLDQIEGKQSGRRYTYLKLAATLALLIATGLGIMTLRQPQAEEVAYSYMTPELVESKAYYGQMISEQMALINDHQSKIDPEVLADLAHIDDDLDLLLQDLKDNADNEEVVTAIIKLYRTKLLMLTEILDELQQDNDDNETII